MVIELPASTFPLQKIGSDGWWGLPGCQRHPAVTDENGEQCVEFTREQFDLIRATRAKTDTLTDSPATKT